jgi:hypothetical protein
MVVNQGLNETRGGDVVRRELLFGKTGTGCL